MKVIVCVVFCSDQGAMSLYEVCWKNPEGSRKRSHGVCCVLLSIGGQRSCGKNDERISRGIRKKSLCVVLYSN